MKLKRMLLWLMLALLPLFLFTGCGDLEPEMQDTRTVILKMDLHEKSSSRTSLVSAADIAAYQTHLVLAVHSWENLRSDYRSYYSNFAQKLMNPQDKRVSMEIPLNTNMKIFAFLFSENYSLPQLIMGREVGYYGESQSFSIGGQTDSLSLGISLIQATTNTVTDTATPTVTFSPPNGATGVPISSNITITFNEAMRNTNDTPLTDSNIDSLITLRYSATGANIPFDATIDANKQVITIDPTSNFIYSHAVYVYIGATVEDAANNAIAATYITFNTALDTCTAVYSCSATASGSFYVNNDTLSGIYDYYHALGLLGNPGFDNSTGCASNTSFISGKGPSGTNSLIIQDVITSSTTFANKAIYYSDSSCVNQIASMITGYKEVSVGDNVTGLTTTIGTSNYPSHASKVTYKEDCLEVKGYTSVGTDYLNTLLSSSFVTTGQTHTCQGSGESTYALWAADNLSASWSRLSKEKSTTAYPSDWSSNSNSLTKL